VVDILPDSRPRERRGAIETPHGRLVQLYCANCGKPYGRVAEKHITFAFVMCQPCADKYGNDAHFYQEPDAVFWERVANAQAEEFGRPLNPIELAVQLDDPTTTLAKLAEEWRKFVRKVG
jgi:NAD-dependent SIR2 family protein deacetylase